MIHLRPFVQLVIKSTGVVIVLVVLFFFYLILMCEQLLYLNETHPSIRLSQGFCSEQQPGWPPESHGKIYFYSFPSKRCIAAAESPAADFAVVFVVELKTAAVLFQPSFFLTFGRDPLETAGEAHLRTCSTRYCCQLALRRVCSFCSVSPWQPRLPASLFFCSRLFCFVLFCAEASFQDLQLLRMSLCLYFVFPSARTCRVWHRDPFAFGKGISPLALSLRCASRAGIEVSCVSGMI